MFDSLKKKSIKIEYGIVRVIVYFPAFGIFLDVILKKEKDY